MGSVWKMEVSINKRHSLNIIYLNISKNPKNKFRITALLKKKEENMLIKSPCLVI